MIERHNNSTTKRPKDAIEARALTGCTRHHMASVR